MYVECPKCGTVFRVTTPQLTQADGQVRCGECATVFDGMSTLSAFAPNEAEDAQDASAQPELDIPAAPPADEPDADAPAFAPEPPQESDAEVPTPAAAPRGRAGRTLWGLMAVLLLAGLGAQWAYEARQTLQAHPSTAPWIERYCAVLGCEIAPRRDPERMEVLTRNVYSHPNVDDALMITASFVNTAAYAQPYPRVQVSLLDLQGRLVGTRLFEPAQYLPQGSDAAQAMEPGAAAELQLEIVDPGSHALAFEFDFH
jgi:predicted Zn finger-like uncharacterized protein